MARRDITFDLINGNVVDRLSKEGRIELPHRQLDIPKDERWNEKQMSAKILQGILNGDSIPTIAKSMEEVVGRNEVSAMRNARTMVTSAQNQGRLDSFNNLAAQGVVMKKEWEATPDDRTRPTHIDIDGEEQDLDKPFSNGCMFPGDGKGPAEEVWNCRCAMGSHIIGFRRRDGSISRVNYTPDRTIHEDQMEKYKERYAELSRISDISGQKYTTEDIGIEADFADIDLSDEIMQASIDYSQRMQMDDIERFNEIFNTAEYVTETDESYYDRNNNIINISKSANGTTVFHESTHWFDYNQNYTITEQTGKWKYLVDKNGDLTGEREWIPHTYIVKENASFSDYIAYQWNRVERGETNSFSDLDMKNFIEKLGLSDTYGYNRNPDDVEHDLRAFRDYFASKNISRTDPDFVHLSDFISAMYYDGNLGSLSDGGHSYNYWTSGDEKRINEITVGYNLLRATGREDMLDIERELAPNLMNLIETEWRKIW